MKKRLLCLLLASVMLFGSMIGCANENKPDSTDSKKDTQAATNTTESDTSEQGYTDSVPEMNLNGKEISILAKKKAGVEDELYSEGEKGILINDKVYIRNRNVEDRLGVKMKVDLVDEPHENLPKEVASGSGHFVISDSTYFAIQEVMKGSYRNLNESPYVDTDKLYWSQGYNNIASYGDKQYLATGSIALSLFRYMFITIYNKKLFENKGVGDLVEVVKNYEWTLEYQESIIKDTYVDVNNNGKMDKDDFYGFVTGDIVSVDPYCVASGIELISKDESSGEWIYDTSKLEQMDALGEVVRRIYKECNGTYVFKGAESDDTGKTNIVEMFSNQNGMMATVQLYALETNAGNMDFDYGIAPIPKLSKDQKFYASYVQDQVTSYGISIVTKDDDMEMVSAFLEALASESYKIVVDAYYNTALYRYLKNPESKETLNMIYDSVKFDFVGAYSNLITGCVMRDQLRPILSGSNTRGISSTMKRWEPKASKALKDINQKLDKLSD